MVAGDAEACWLVGQAIEEVGPPQRAIRGNQLRGGLAAPMRPLGKRPQLNPSTVSHRGVPQVDLEPVPHDDSGTRERENMLHDASATF